MHVLHFLHVPPHWLSKKHARRGAAGNAALFPPWRAPLQHPLPLARAQVSAGHRCRRTRTPLTPDQPTDRARSTSFFDAHTENLVRREGVARKTAAQLRRWCVGGQSGECWPAEATARRLRWHVGHVSVGRHGSGAGAGKTAAEASRRGGGCASGEFRRRRQRRRWRRRRRRLRLGWLPEIA